jgi:NAD(P)-dependent dehydrogenase (short-subunit alcohol dehydrogenase family)
MTDSNRVGASIPESYQPGPRALENKTILVTGASTGIGESAALRYAARGATVILLARSVPRLEAVYDAIVAAGGAQPAAIPFDLGSSDENSYAELARVIGEQFPHLDGLLLNASVLGERRPLEQSSWKDWQETMHINVNSQFLTVRALMPLLREAPTASVVFTSSGVGRVGRAYWGAYCVSKFATEAMMQILSSETENTSFIRVNCVNPGATNTAMRRTA